jgi:hypothetical protein
MKPLTMTRDSFPSRQIYPAKEASRQWGYQTELWNKCLMFKVRDDIHVKPRAEMMLHPFLKMQ